MAPLCELSRRILITVGATGVTLASGLRMATHRGDSGDTAGGGETAAVQEQMCLEGDPSTQGVCPEQEDAITLLDASLPECTGIGDLGTSFVEEGRCCYTVTMIDTCKYGPVVGCGCAHGRPLLFAEGPRTSSAVPGGIWSDRRTGRPEISRLDARGRARLAHYWASIGLNEHASIASFHRAALELLAHGAPPGLAVNEIIVRLERAAHQGYGFAPRLLWNNFVAEQLCFRYRGPVRACSPQGRERGAL